MVNRSNNIPERPRLTSGEPADRVWFTLVDKTYAPANLHSAFHKVWQNGGSAGADAQTGAHCGRRAEEELQRRHVSTATGSAGLDTQSHGRTEKRPLGIPAVRGRIVPGALRRVDTLLQAGHVWVVDADLKSYFGTIPHERLRALVQERVGDGRVLAPSEISNLKSQPSQRN